jgi:hypothetical protein
LAKGITKSRKSRERLLVAKTTMNSTCLEIKQNLATMKVAGAMRSSARVMQHMGAMIKLPEIAAVSQAMAKEMMKTGLIEEMTDDMFSMMDGDELEEEADEEVQKVGGASASAYVTPFVVVLCNARTQTFSRSSCNATANTATRARKSHDIIMQLQLQTLQIITELTTGVLGQSVGTAAKKNTVAAAKTKEVRSATVAM